MSELARETGSMDFQSNGQVRPPKITQHEAAFLIARGPYVARLAAQEKLYSYARSITTASDEIGPNLPEYVADDLRKSVEHARAELDRFDGQYTEIPQAEIDATCTEPVGRALGRRSLLPSIVTQDTAYHGSDWRDLALCAQTNPEEFFPEKGGTTRQAKKVCLSCEVRDECLNWALETDQRFGVWGGLNEQERRKLKKRTA